MLRPRLGLLLNTVNKWVITQNANNIYAKKFFPTKNESPQLIFPEDLLAENCTLHFNISEKK
jgi:hypothetical protein